MKKPFLFTDIKQETNSGLGNTRIYFTLEKNSFYLNINTVTVRQGQKQNKFGTIHHDKNLTVCPFCGGKARVYCRVLSKNDIKKELFEALIQEPPIRLEWIYLDYPK